MKKFLIEATGVFIENVVEGAGIAVGAITVPLVANQFLAWLK